MNKPFNSAKSLLFCTLVICEVTIGKKISVPNYDIMKSSKLNECQRCKVLTKSFNHWLDITSRGNFEGGDAAWEETKLKSYARSEIRLVEIQEGLCSELKKHQDQCYSLAEESEQAIEEWWLNVDPGSEDIYTWLCIETLKECCPQSHFGETCESCPLDKNSKVCGERGKCDGDGTRSGSGACLCQKGYTGRFCEDCAKNYYRENGVCKPCDKACDGCSGDGPVACKTCSSGWQLESNVCIDVNECLYPSACKSNQYCINTEGFHICEPCDPLCKTCSGMGPSNCTSCEQGLALWSNICIDYNVKNELTRNAISRLALYFGLFLITYFIHRKSMSLASIILIIIAVFIYFSEKTSQMNIVDVILKMLKAKDI